MRTRTRRAKPNPAPDAPEGEAAIDITPRLAVGRQLIQAYGNGGFRIAERAWQGSVLVFPDETRAWPVTAVGDLTAQSLAAVAEAGTVEVLLIGCGPALAFIPAAVRDPLRAAGVVIDGMDTGAACRTYNVLLAEERRVAAALIAVD